jgi:hypothetical protein
MTTTPTTPPAALRVSKCCHAPLKIISSNEGTSYHVCSKCGKPTDPATPQAALERK